MKHYIYADNAATTKLDTDAFEAMKPFLLEEYGNASQPYSFSRTAKKALKEARAQIATCIGALPEEIYFTSCGTESDNWVIKQLALSDPQKQTIITSQIEHHAVLNSCASLEKLGYPIVYLPVDSKGIIAPETLKKQISKNTRLVSVMFANNEIGTIEPIKELCDIAHKNGAYFHTDAVQAVGHTEIDVKELGVDFLSASAHKFNGPKGIGFLYAKKGCGLSSFIDGGAQEFGMRAGTENVASIVGMATALQKNCDSLSKNKERLLNLERQLLQEIQGLDFIRNGAALHIPGNMSLSFHHADGEAILHRLDLKGIAVSTGSACDSVNTQISHVLTAIHLDREYAEGTIRISLGKYNSQEDTHKIAEELKKIVAH